MAASSWRVWLQGRERALNATMRDGFPFLEISAELSAPIDRTFKLDISTSSSQLAQKDMVGVRIGQFRFHMQQADFQSLLKHCRNSRVDKIYTKTAVSAPSNNGSSTTDNKNNNPLMRPDSSVNKITEQWISHQLKLREQEFTHYKDLSVFATTWNVNNKPVSEDLTPWLQPHLQPDIYVIGLQEIDTSTEAFLMMETPREAYWINLLSKHLPGYSRLISRQLVGLLIVVLIKNSLGPHVSNMQADFKGCGVMGMGNKGGVACRLQVYDSILCFVNSHLAADSAMVDRRNQDYADLCERLTFTSTDGGSQFSIWDSDVLVWIGDLNYRISLPEDEAKTMLKSNPYSEILEYDQLTIERRGGRVFEEFDEVPISFPPTYKYDPGTNVFDTSEKKRTPSWCDRILVRKQDLVSVRQYSSCMDVMTSDHKPVYALFAVKAKLIDEPRRLNTLQLIMRELDRYENECIPDVRLSCQSLEFGTVRYDNPVHREIELTNVGSVIAQIRFIPKLQEENICPSWMAIQPPIVMMLPSEKMTVRFTVHVDALTAASSNLMPPKARLDDILILHLENGKDYFISVAAEYLPSCLGMDLGLLIRLPDPIRAMSGDGRLRETIKVFQAGSKVEEKALSVPKELWRLVDYLFHFGLGVENLFMAPGNKVMCGVIIDCLDTGADFPDPSTLLNEIELVSPRPRAGSRMTRPPSQLSAHQHQISVVTTEEKRILFVHSVADVLIQFLETLPNPVIPFGVHYQRCIDAYQTYPLAKQAVSNLPTPHYNTFVYLTSFLRELLGAAQGTDLTREKLAIIFSSVFMRTSKPVAEKYAEALARKKSAFLMHFLSPQV